MTVSLSDLTTKTYNTEWNGDESCDPDSGFYTCITSKVENVNVWGKRQLFVVNTKTGLLVICLNQ